MEHEGSLLCSQEPPPAPILSQLDPVHTLQPYSLRSILILPTHLRLGLPSRLFPSNQNYVSISHLPLHACHTPRASHLPWFDDANNILWRENLWRSSLCNFLQSPVTSSLLGPKILLSNLFSNTLNLCSSLNVRDQVSHPYKTTGRIIVLYILIFTYLYLQTEHERFWTAQYQAFPKLSVTLISYMQYFDMFVLKYFNFSTFSNDLLATFVSIMILSCSLVMKQNIHSVISAFASRPEIPKLLHLAPPSRFCFNLRPPPPGKNT
jgi:hypothetical protein